MRPTSASASTGSSSPCCTHCSHHARAPLRFAWGMAETPRRSAADRRLRAAPAPALVLEGKLDIGEIAREHARARGRDGAPRLSCGGRRDLVSVMLLHVSGLGRRGYRGTAVHLAFGRRGCGGLMGGELAPARTLAALGPAGSRSRAFGLLFFGRPAAAAGSAGRSLGTDFCAVRLARFLPRLAGGAGLLAGPLGLALGLFDPFAGALELLWAIRTRCRATSASSRARSSGSAGSPAEGALGAEASGLPLAPDGIAPADRFFLAGFPMQKAWWQRAASVTQWSHACHRDFIHRFCE